MKKSTNQDWNFVWAEKNGKESYNHEGSRNERANNKLAYFLESGINFREKDRILEAGCGDGAILFSIMSHFKVEGYGIDFSETAKAIAFKKMRETEMCFDYQLGDVSNLPYSDNFFDTVISLGVIEHFTNPKNAMDEMFRVVKNKGQVVLMTPNSFSFGFIDRVLKVFFRKWTFGYQREYTTQQLRSIAEEAGFTVVKEEVVLRKSLKSDSLSFKIISRLDQILNVFNKRCGFYSYVFLTKGEKND